MKLAFVGCGRIASVHAESIIKYVLETNNTIEIVALIDTSLLNAEKFKKSLELSCKIFTQLEEAAHETALDTVIILSPIICKKNLLLELLVKNLMFFLKSLWLIPLILHKEYWSVQEALIKSL